MLVSQTAEYALRVMAWLAISSPDRAVRAADLSKSTDIPVHYLWKILRRLVVAGVLTSQKGKGGGFRLARPPDEIRFTDILARRRHERKRSEQHDQNPVRLALLLL